MLPYHILSFDQQKTGKRVLLEANSMVHTCFDFRTATCPASGCTAAAGGGSSAVSALVAALGPRPLSGGSGPGMISEVGTWCSGACLAVSHLCTRCDHTPPLSSGEDAPTRPLSSLGGGDALRRRSTGARCAAKLPAVVTPPLSTSCRGADSDGNTGFFFLWACALTAAMAVCAGPTGCGEGLSFDPLLAAAPIAPPWNGRIGSRWGRGRDCMGAIRKTERRECR